MYWFNVCVAVFALTFAVWFVCILLTEVLFIKRYLADKHFKLYNFIGCVAQVLGITIVVVLAFALVAYLLLLAYSLLTGTISIGG